MKAGLDLGTTLIKICYKKNKKYYFKSFNYQEMNKLIKLLKKEKIDEANIVGINKLPKQLNFLKIKPKRGLSSPSNLIDTEIKTQVRGLKKISRLPQDMLVVSIGTGTSYTRVNKNRIKKIELGNSLGGGFILGLAKLLKYENWDVLTSKAKKGDHKNVDIYYKDLIVSNLGNLTKSSSKNDIAAGIMHTVAVMIWTDIMNISQDKNIVIIGGSLNNNFCLQKLLKNYLTKSKRQVYFIKNGEFASSLGALLSY
ncbi:MAG: hypothetical protein ABID45_02750 [Patescibacteria group bacterium]